MRRAIEFESRATLYGVAWQGVALGPTGWRTGCWGRWGSSDSSDLKKLNRHTGGGPGAGADGDRLMNQTLRSSTGIGAADRVLGQMGAV